MSESVMLGYADTISSGLMPIRSCQIATSSTVIRCPSMRGLPPHVAGVLTIRTRSAAGVRLAWGISLIVIIAAEMVGATVGLGYMVLEAQQTFRTERVFSGIFVIGLIGFATDLGFRRLRWLLLPWYRESDS